MRVLALLFVLCIVVCAYASSAALSATKVQDEEITSHQEAVSTSTSTSSSTLQHNLPTESEGNVIMIDTMLTAARNEKQQQQGLTAGKVAHDEYCKCASSYRHLSFCPDIIQQCEDTLCNPICLGTAFSVELEVDCSAAPGWKYCEQFKQQVYLAEKAIAAQFQAHFCIQTQLCKKTERLIDWVENHTFAGKYPDSLLPIGACLPEYIKHNQLVQDKMCKACQQVVSAKIKRGTCVPRNGAVDAQPLQKSSMKERCEFVADYVGVHAHSLLTELNEQVCSCLGCCGTGTCYFPNAEKEWLNNLIHAVKNSVSKDLKAVHIKA